MEAVCGDMLDEDTCICTLVGANTRHEVIISCVDVQLPGVYE